MYRNFKLLFLPLDGGRLGGGERKTPHPPLTPPIKGGGIFSCRRPNLSCKTDWEMRMLIEIKHGIDKNEFIKI
ncbi:MAG: hypothetical protein A2Z58_06550 [Planctomycetes bacterium RIFCSPHIGHO2_12_42_15]|nr:MAG: hypothetical protein A2Z58_06550 [Planctomycetes bacterium RIFCSPHIGHO2_12_42_15]